MNTRSIFITLTILLIGVGAGYFINQYMSAGDGLPGVSADRLPDNATFIPHPEDKEFAQERGGVAMRHYATPKAIENGGPIFGVVGDRIISVEYEIPASSIGSRPIGDPAQPGRLLSVAGIGEQIQASYDHFHIGSAHRHTHVAEEGETRSHEHAEEGEEQIYLIHLMLIEHERELALNVVCS